MLELSFFAPQSISKEARASSIKFWLSEKALPPEIAEQRAAQVICHATLDDQIIAVASGHVNVSKHLRQPYFQYRTYVGQAHRRQSYAGKMLAESFAGLSEFFCQQANPAAIGVQLEIPGTLAPLDDHLVWPETQFSYAGTTAEGSHLRVRYFEQVKMKAGKV